MWLQKTVHPHEYIDRRTGDVRRERLLGDRIVSALYSPWLENAPGILGIAGSSRLSSALAFLNYGELLGNRAASTLEYLARTGADFSEFVKAPETFGTAREVFERQIRYWECRPMPAEESTVVCPTDARVLVASQNDSSVIFLKEKYFDREELLDKHQHKWSQAFAGGEYAVFRLTPDKYHYVHLPVTGVVEDLYEIYGACHSCNPSAIVSLIAPHAKNRRIVSIIQTDIEEGTEVGLVAVVEVVALMVGQIVQCYSREKYDWPRALIPGLFVKRGQPKSLFRPGSSTVIVFFQPGRVVFCEDLLLNRFRRDAQSRFSLGLDRPIVETDVTVRSPLARHPEAAPFGETSEGETWAT